MHVIHCEDACPCLSNSFASYNQQSLLAGGVGGGVDDIMRGGDFLSAAAIFDAAGELSDIGAYASAAAFDSSDGPNSPLPGLIPHALPSSGSANASTSGIDGSSWHI